MNFDKMMKINLNTGANGGSDTNKFKIFNDLDFYGNIVINEKGLICGDNNLNDFDDNEYQIIKRNEELFIELIKSRYQKDCVPIAKLCNIAIQRGSFKDVINGNGETVIGQDGINCIVGIGEPCISDLTFKGNITINEGKLILDATESELNGHKYSFTTEGLIDKDKYQDVKNKPCDGVIKVGKTLDSFGNPLIDMKARIHIANYGTKDDMILLHFDQK